MSKLNYTLKDVQDMVHDEVARDYWSGDTPLNEIRDMMFLGLAEEAGEVAGICKRLIRGRDVDSEKANREYLAEELGDVLWYLAAIADGFGLSLDDIWQQNRHKLEERYGQNK